MTKITTVTPEVALGDICTYEDGPNVILHEPGPDCERLHGLRITEYRCSICDLPWGGGVYSQHERCAKLNNFGDRQNAYCVTYLSDGSELRYTSIFAS